MEVDKIKKVFKRKGYSDTTIKSYSHVLKNLSQFFDKELEEISLEEIIRYLTNLKLKKKRSEVTVNLHKQACVFWFNTYLNKGYDFDQFVIKRKYSREIEFFSEDELLELISKAANIRDRVYLSLSYGCGLDVSEINSIKIKDLDLTRHKVRVKLTRQNKSKFLPLPLSIIDDIEMYLVEYKPMKYLFEGRKSRGQFSTRTGQSIFKRTLSRTNIHKPLTFRSLRHSYINHLEIQGENLISILDHLGINTEQSFYAYGKSGNELVQITQSPLDFLFNRVNTSEFKIDQLKKYLTKVENEDEREFLSEAILCLHHGQIKAGIIMAWNAAIRNIHYKLLKHSLHSLNAAIKKHFPKAKDVKTIDDFAYVKESIVLLSTVDLHEFDKNEKAVLENCLNLRNKCGHPGKYRPKELAAAAFIEDLITIVFSK